jgi:hypothetical protein
VGRDGVNIGLICSFGKPEYFFSIGWTLILLEAQLICPSGKVSLSFLGQTIILILAETTAQ